MGSRSASRRLPWHSAPRKPTTSGESANKGATCFGRKDPATPTMSPARRPDKAGDIADGHMFQKRTCPLPGGIEHQPPGARVKRGSDGVEARHGVGEEDEDEPCARGPRV